MALIHVCSFSLFFGVCLFLISFCMDLRQCLDGLKEAAEKCAQTESCINRAELKAKLIESIRFQADVKQLGSFSRYFLEKCNLGNANHVIIYLLVSKVGHS